MISRCIVTRSYVGHFCISTAKHLFSLCQKSRARQRDLLTKPSKGESDFRGFSPQSLGSSVSGPVVRHVTIVMVCVCVCMSMCVCVCVCLCVAAASAAWIAETVRGCQD